MLLIEQFLLVGILVSYLLGSLPFGLWIGLAWKGVDIRTLGSKNIGATNVLRVLGWPPATVVFLLDTLKGMLGIVVFSELFRYMFAASMPIYYRVPLGICAILGHSFSPFLRFKGGKGVATSLGVLLALNPIAALIGLFTWGAVLLITRYVSLASLVAAYTLPCYAWQMPAGMEREWMLCLGIGLALLVTVKHRGNIQRLLHGAEPRIGQRVSVPSESAEVR